MKKLIDKLYNEHILEKEEFIQLISNCAEEEYLFEKSREIRHKIYGKDVYIRGLIEVSSYCKNNCLYCGIRCANKNAQRYRLSESQILGCCENGYNLGFRTFVLQGGEDEFFTDDFVCGIIDKIKSKYPDCAVTLSLGERSYESYLRLYNAGADRYLLRHETASKAHYEKLHPKNMSYDNRIKCLYNLKKIGYQTGSGFMVGSPYQTHENLAEDMLFLKKLNPQMVGIGPFIPQHDTPMRDMQAGTAKLTIYMVALLRLMLPYALLPSTTALGTIDPLGREKGILAGANVVMPNLSPVDVRKKYELYDNKICTGDEAAECKNCMSKRMESIGYKVVTSRGDFIKPEK